MRSAFAPVGLALVALAASLARWALQGSGNLYTARSKVFWVPDPDLGYKVSAEHPLWIGLEVCAVIAAIAAGLVVAGWWIRRRERKRDRREQLLRIATWIVAAAPLILPVLAFASGGGPEGGVSLRPDGPGVAATAAQAGGESITGALTGPAGTYKVVEHDGTAVVARIKAGGESFNARFATVEGSWTGDPRDLKQPMQAQIAAAAASVDTGIGERSKHAREGYLHADKFPQVTFAFGKLTAAHPDGAGQIAFRAEGTVGLIGQTHKVEVTGTLKQADAAALQRLKLTGDVLIAQADFSLAVRETALASDAGDFDEPRIPIHVSLVLRHTGG